MSHRTLGFAGLTVLVTLAIVFWWGGDHPEPRTERGSASTTGPAHVPLTAASTQNVPLGVVYQSTPARAAVDTPPGAAQDPAEHDRLMGLLTSAAAGVMPDHNASLLALTGALRESDALCARVGAFAMADGIDRDRRALALDLLTGAGTPAAQGALRQALDAAAVRGEARYPLLYQRVSLLADPDPATLDWLGARAEAPGPEGEGAALLALGAAAGTAARRGSVEGVRLADTLVAGLDGADAARRALLLRAVGNAGLESHAPAVAEQSADADPAVRHAAVTALRKMRGALARDTLLAMATDPDSAIQRAALRGLMGRDLPAVALDRLAAAVRSQGIEDTALATMASLTLPLGADAHPVLVALLGRPALERALAARVRAALAGG